MTVLTEGGQQETTKLERIGKRARFRKDTIVGEISRPIFSQKEM